MSTERDDCILEHLADLVRVVRQMEQDSEDMLLESTIEYLARGYFAGWDSIDTHQVLDELLYGLKPVWRYRERMSTA